MGIIKTFVCPRCKLVVKVTVPRSNSDLFLFVCKNCLTKTAFYKGKPNIITDRQALIILKKYVCHSLNILPNFSKTTCDHSRPIISDDDILNLKIDLGLCKTSEDFLSKN